MLKLETNLPTNNSTMSSKRFKLYRSLHAITFGTSIVVNGTTKYITFTGGSTHTGIIRGAYGTSDPDEQNAIESDSLYGVEFTLDERMSEPAPKAKDQEPEGNDDDYIIVDGVTNAQQAKSYLVSKYEGKVTPDMVANIEKMKEVMASVDEKPIKFNGYNPR